MSAADLDPDFDRPSPSPQARAAAELLPGETLLWAGRPIPARAAAAHGGPALMGIVVGLTFVMRAVLPSLPGGLPDQRPTPPGAAVLVALGGLALCIVPARAYRRAARTAYAVTDRRAILLEPRLLGGFTARCYGPDRLGALTRRSTPGAGDDLTFEDNSRTFFRKRPIARRGFLHIEDAAAVEALIRSTLLTPPSGPTDRLPGATKGKFKPPGTALVDPDPDGPPGRDALETEGLDPGETLVWAGRPRAPLLLARLIPAAPLFSFALGYGLLAGAIAISVDDSAFGRAFCGLLSAGGLFGALGMLGRAVGAALAADVRYLITDRRVLIRRPTWTDRVAIDVFAPADLAAMVRRQRPDGSGDLVFAEGTPGDPTGDRGFLAVDDVQAVEKFLRSTLLDGRRDP